MTVPPWMPELYSLAEEVVAAARGRRDALAAITVSVPPDTDHQHFSDELGRRLQRMGMRGVLVWTRSAPGPVSIQSIEFER